MEKTPHVCSFRKTKMFNRPFYQCYCGKFMTAQQYEREYGKENSNNGSNGQRVQSTVPSVQKVA